MSEKYFIELSDQVGKRLHVQPFWAMLEALMEARVEGQLVLSWVRMPMAMPPNSYISTGPTVFVLKGTLRSVTVSLALDPEGPVLRRSKAKTAEGNRIFRKNFLSPFP